MRQFLLFTKRIVLFSSLLLTPILADEKKVELISTLWDPWITEDSEKKPSGIFIKVTEEIFKEMDQDYIINYYPWKRSLKRIKDGSSDALLMLLKEKEREKYMLFSDPILNDKTLLYYTTKKPVSWNNFKDLEKYTIGITSGHNYGKEFEKAMKVNDYSIDFAITDLKNIEKLVKGRTDLIFINQSVMDAFLKKNPNVTNVRFSTKIIIEDIYHIGISKKAKNKINLPLMNSIIKRLRENGKIDEIVQQGL